MRERLTRTRLTLPPPPNAEAFEHVLAEGHADGNVRGVPTSRNQHAANAWRVIARVECVPGAANVYFKPGRKILGLLRGRKPDVTDIARAIASRNIQTSTERDCQVGVIPADPSLLVKCFRGCSGRARELIAEGYVLLDKVTDCLNSFPAAWRVAKHIPCDSGWVLAVAIAAAQQIDPVSYTH